MSKSKLYNLLQLNGGTFPSGGFSQSWGLETYVYLGRVNNAETFKEFMETYLISCIGKCEGPIACEAYELTGTSENEFDEEGLRKLEQLSQAAKVTKESREAANRMGKAFFRIMQAVLNDNRFEKMGKILRTKDMSYPVVYGVACRVIDLDIEEALGAYIYSTANTLIQSAVKLIPLGNTESQEILFGASELMDRTVSLCMATDIEDITNFCPGIDIASIRHETLPVRLYMT